jgi:hypothetical protein
MRGRENKKEARMVGYFVSVSRYCLTIMLLPNNTIPALGEFKYSQICMFGKVNTVTFLLFQQNVPKLNFHRGGYLSRCEFRSLWLGPNSPYRTSVNQVRNKSIYKTVREVLPGQLVEESDAFLQDFLHHVQRDGLMTFDTERQEYPPMVQVINVTGFQLLS